MITFLQGDNIFSSAAKTLVCPVNTVGVMGNGVAAAFKYRYAGLYDAYLKACRDGVFQRNGYFVFTEKYGKQILCFPTKRHWVKDSQLKWIRFSMKKLSESYKEHGITTIVFPKIGCGKGNLEWEEVKPLFEEYLEDTDMEITVLETDYS